jgi:glycosyltransferase involved in cell wall biosynthesis
LVFEPGEPVGHQLGYLQHLAEYWCERSIPGRLDILVVPDFISMHREFARWCSGNHDHGIALRSIAPPQARRLEELRGSMLGRSLLQGNILAGWLAELAPDDCLMMCFDQLQPTLALSQLGQRGVGLHGIYFRPMLARSLYGAAWRNWPEMAWRRLLLKGALRNPGLRTLFCLDRACIPYIRKQTSRVRAIALPDPVREYQRRANPACVRRDLGAEPGRALLLLFGELSRRKGTFQLIEALSLLSAQDAARLAVVIAGPIPKGDKPMIDRLATALRAASAVQLLIVDRFIADHEIQDLFAAADFVIAPYQQHIGMSAVLVRAAMAGKPIIGPDYGLLGQLIRRKRLGITVQCSRAEAIARAIGVSLSQPPQRLFDAASAKVFAESNRAGRFSSTIFGRLLEAS